VHSYHKYVPFHFHLRLRLYRILSIFFKLIFNILVNHTCFVLNITYLIPFIENFYLLLLVHLFIRANILWCFLYFFLSVQNRCCSGRCPPPFQLFQSLWLPHFARGPKVSASRRRGKAFYTLNAPQMMMLLPQMTTMMMMIMVNGDPHPHPLLFFFVYYLEKLILIGNRKH